jgi:pyruvate dehydrogenase E2 component (dihydrolipoamide acetyltransferase)
LATKIVMPRLSLTMKTGSVIQWFKKEGEKVEKEEPVVEVLSDKVTYDVESPASGILKKILAEEGMDVPVGATLAFVAAPDEEVSEGEIQEIVAGSTPSRGAEAETARSKQVEAPVAGERIIASPAAKRLARDHKVDLTLVHGTGAQGRIVEEDVQAFLDKGAELTTHVKEEVPLTGIRKTTAERVATSFHTAAHSFIIMDVDMTNIVQLRERTHASYTAALVYAVAKALRVHLRLNSTLVDETIRVYDDINVGVAVSTEKGLIVPVIQHADTKQLEGLSLELAELVEKARQGRLSNEQLTGGTFTITNLGMYDVDLFLPIINPPEAAILAAGSIVKKPFVVDGEITAKAVMTLALAYDHRIIDGAPASEFLRSVKNAIERDQLCDEP